MVASVLSSIDFLFAIFNVLPDTRSITAVSYTHLDVYKRQCSNTASRLFHRGAAWRCGEAPALPLPLNRYTQQRGRCSEMCIRDRCGLLKEVDGTVRLDGQTLKAKQRNKASFCVMQDVNHQLFSDSVWNECELAQPDCPSERIEEILRSFDLLDFKDRHPMALSGGCLLYTSHGPPADRRHPAL